MVVRRRGWWPDWLRFSGRPGMGVGSRGPGRGDESESQQRQHRDKLEDGRDASVTILRQQRLSILDHRPARLQLH